MPTSTPMFNQEQFERITLGATVSEYNMLVLIVSVGALALVVIFLVVLWLNRKTLNRRFREWLKD